MIATFILLNEIKKYDKYHVELEMMEFAKLGDSLLLEANSKLESITKERKRVSSYTNRIIQGNPKHVILDLDSIKSTIIPNEILGSSSIQSLTIKGSNSKNGFILKKIPHNIFKLTNLEYLDISNSEINSIPITVTALNKLKEINISNSTLPQEEKELLRKRIPNNCIIIDSND